MRRKLLIVGDVRYMMIDVFGLSDRQVDDVKRFMEDDFTNMSDVIKKIAKSNMSDRQKMLAAYICGNTCGVNIDNVLGHMMEKDRDDIGPMAG